MYLVTDESEFVYFLLMIHLGDVQSAARRYGGGRSSPATGCSSLQRWPVTTLFSPGDEDQEEEEEEVSGWAQRNGSSPNASSPPSPSTSSPLTLSPSPPPLPASSPPPPLPSSSPPRSSTSSLSSPTSSPSAATLGANVPVAAKGSASSSSSESDRKPEAVQSTCAASSSVSSSSFPEVSGDANAGKTQTKKQWRFPLRANVSSSSPAPESGGKEIRLRGIKFATPVFPTSSSSYSSSAASASKLRSSSSSSSSPSVTFRLPSACSAPSQRWRQGICLDRFLPSEPEEENRAKEKEEEKEEGAATEEEGCIPDEKNPDAAASTTTTTTQFQPSPHRRDAEVERAKYMERFRFKPGGIKAKARAMFKKSESGGNLDNGSSRRGSSGGGGGSGSSGGCGDGGSGVGLGTELGARRWISRSLGDGLSNGRVPNNNNNLDDEEDCRKEYEMWKSRATAEFNNKTFVTTTTMSDSAVSSLNNTDDVGNDSEDITGFGWSSSSRFSPPPVHHQHSTFTTFSSSSNNSLTDRKWKPTPEYSSSSFSSLPGAATIAETHITDIAKDYSSLPGAATIAETHITDIAKDYSFPAKWRMNFDDEGDAADEDICTTNIDDLIRGSDDVDDNNDDDDERWSFGQNHDRHGGQARTLTSSEEAWTSVSSLADAPQSTPQNPRGFDSLDFGSTPTPTHAIFSFGVASSPDRAAKDDANSPPSADDDTDTDSVFLADVDSDTRDVSAETPLRGKSYRTETTSSSRELSAFFPTDRQSDVTWHTVPLVGDERNQSDDSVIENFSTITKESDKHRDFFQDDYDWTQNRFQNLSGAYFPSVAGENNDNNDTRTNPAGSPENVTRHSPNASTTVSDFQTGLSKDFKRRALKDLTGSPKNLRGSPKLRRSSVKDPLTTVHEVSDGDGDGDEDLRVVVEDRLPPGNVVVVEAGASAAAEEVVVDGGDAKTEQQKRLDAWVSSIQTHWDSTGSSVDFPFSFEDSFRGLGSVSDDMFLEFPELEYDDHSVQLFMADDDTRFGFSVIGGYDEGIAPRVDEVTVGSPADRAELEVGDEIVEVNGMSVERSAHAEIIAHIHQCIQSKAIRLRVKRLKEGEKVPTISKVHDAYIIAVEENARRKLEDASANHRVVPVDLTNPHPLKQEEAVTAFRAEKHHQPLGAASPPAREVVDPPERQLQKTQPQQPQQQQPHKGPPRPQELLPLNCQRLTAQRDGLTKTANASVAQPLLRGHQKSTSSPVKPLRQHNHQKNNQPNTDSQQQRQQQQQQPSSPPSSAAALTSSSSSSFQTHRHNQNQPPNPAYQQHQHHHHHHHQQQQQQQQQQQPQQRPSSHSGGGEAETTTTTTTPTPPRADPDPAAVAPSMPVAAEKKRKSSNHNNNNNSPSYSSSKHHHHGGGLNATQQYQQEAAVEVAEAIEMNGMMMREKERESPQRKGKAGKGRPGSRGNSSKAVSNPADTPLIEDMMVAKAGGRAAGGGNLAPNGKASSHNNSLHAVSSSSTTTPATGTAAVADDDDDDFRAQDMYDDDFYYGEQPDSYSEVVLDSGPHREMAIDCPDSFVATVKTPPRYPPPPPSSSSGPTTTTTTAPRVPPTTPSRSVESVGGVGGGVVGGARDEATRTEATLSDAATAMAAAMNQPRPTTEQLDRLRKHQEELRKRREEESRQQQEQDFLRSSLRESKKLQALENKRMMAQMSSSPPLAPPAAAAPVPVVGIINTGFVDPEVEDVDDAYEDEGDLVDDLDGGEPSVPVERYLKKNAGVEDLLSTLHHIRNRLNSADNTSSSNGSQEVFFLKQLFHNAQFQQAVAMHQEMVEVTSRSPQPRPLGSDSRELAADIGGSTPVPRGFEPAVKELVTLLNKPMVKNLLKAHDDVAERQTHPILQTSESDLIDYPLVQYGEESVKIIHLEKTNEHLGATVKNEGDSVIIARIVKGGAAEKSGLLHEGDEILDVNGIDMRGKNVNEVSEILANMSGTITFMIIPAHTCVEDNIPKPGEIMHLRALFNYDPEDDPYIPCRELGISFRKGDILHAIQLTDPNWWQAHREGEEDHHMLAGLIPSTAFQEQRETIRQQLSAEGKENKKRSRMCACGRKKKKKKKSLYNAGVGEEAEEILTYEEVTKYYPQPNRKRPIVLVGPQDIGRQELRERIMESDFDRFSAAVPHTSRAPAAGEHHGKDYHFISRSVFEMDMLSSKFIEYGEYQGNLYGTSIEAVRQVINQGRICILNLQPESLKILRDTDLKPYIIFVSPPNMEKLRQLQMLLGKPRPTDEQLKEVIEKGREMEEAYSHYFDYILVNMDLDRSYTELLNEINRIEAEPQWVPVSWVNNGYM